MPHPACLVAQTWSADQVNACHATTAQPIAQAIIPPRKNANFWKDKSEGTRVRNQVVEAYQRWGSHIWKKWSGYLRRSLVKIKTHGFKRMNPHGPEHRRVPGLQKQRLQSRGIQIGERSGVAARQLLEGLAVDLIEQWDHGPIQIVQAGKAMGWRKRIKIQRWMT